MLISVLKKYMVISEFIPNTKHNVTSVKHKYTVAHSHCRKLSGSIIYIYIYLTKRLIEMTKLTRSSLAGSWLLIMALVLLRNFPESLWARACTAWRPMARLRFVTLCFCPCSTGSANFFLNCRKLPRHHGIALVFEQ